MLWSLCGGKVFNTALKQFEKRDLSIESGKLLGQLDTKNENTAITLDCTDKFIIPGLADIHTHGAKMMIFDDIHFLGKGGFSVLEKYYLSHGVTSIFPTVYPIPLDRIIKNIEILKEISKSCSINILGLHIETPHLSEKMRGFYNRSKLYAPEISELFRIKQAAGDFPIRLTLAPETEGAIEYIEKAIELGFSVSLGHTDMDECSLKLAANAGADCIAHTFCNMRSTDLDQNLYDSIFADNKLFCELICNTDIVSKTNIQKIYECKGKRGLLSLVSDSISCAGMANDRVYEYNTGMVFHVKHGKPCNSAGKVVANCSDLLCSVRTLAETLNISFSEALLCATSNPCKTVGACDSCGSIDNGKRADVVVLNHDLSVFSVICDGNRII